MLVQDGTELQKFASSKTNMTPLPTSGAWPVHYTNSLRHISQIKIDNKPAHSRPTTSTCSQATPATPFRGSSRTELTRNVWVRMTRWEWSSASSAISWPRKTSHSSLETTHNPTFRTYAAKPRPLGKVVALNNKKAHWGTPLTSPTSSKTSHPKWSKLLKACFSSTLTCATQLTSACKANCSRELKFLTKMSLLQAKSYSKLTKMTLSTTKLPAAISLPSLTIFR